MIAKSFYTLAGSGLGSKAISFATNLILVRLISPESFGKVALVMVIFSISNFIVAGGMADAIIRFNIFDRNKLSAIYTFNISFGLLLYLIIWNIAKYVANYYQEMDLIWIIRVMALDVVFKSFYVVRSARVKQELKFKHIAHIQIVSSISILIGSVLLAYFGLELLALSVKFIIGGFISAITYAIVIKEKYSLNFRFNSIMTPLLYGINLILLGISNSFVRNIPVITMGNFLSLSLIGFYSQTVVLVEMSLGTLQASVQQVLFPVIAGEKKDNLSKYLSEFYRTFLYVFVPSLVLFFLVIEMIVSVVYGHRWIQIASFSRLLVLAVPIRFVSGYLLVLMKAYSSGSHYFLQGLVRLIVFAIPFYFIDLVSVEEVIKLIIFLESITTLYLLFITRDLWRKSDSNVVFLTMVILVCYILFEILNRFNYLDVLPWIITIFSWIMLIIKFRKTQNFID